MVNYLVDLYCGIGGVSYGFQKAGFRVFSCVDSWEKALQIHGKHVDCEHLQLKLGTDESKEIILENLPKLGKEDTLHVHASPPCQNLSTINKKRNLSQGLDLTIWTLQFLIELDLHYRSLKRNVFTWTIEQVPSQHFLTLLSDFDIDVFFKVFTMTDYGVPQARKRLILSNVPNLDNLMKKRKTSALHRYLDIPSNAKYLAAPTYSKSKLIAGSSFVRLKEINDDMVPFTVVSQPALFLNRTKDIIRPLTMQENLKLQGFPASYVNVANGVSTQDLRTMVGNSVPVEFSKAIAKGVLEYYKNN
jgi:DNA (cytosine-5)-methyltransferase 1